MVSVLFYVPKGGLGFGWWVMAFSLVAMGLGPFGSWVRATPQRQRIAKCFTVGVFVGLLASTTYAVWCSACQNCDPFFLEWFFICWPTN